MSEGAPSNTDVRTQALIGIHLVDLNEARNVVRAYLDRIEPVVGETLAIMDALTIEKPFGWVFFYDSPNPLETGTAYRRLVTNAPLIVERETGLLRQTGTACLPEYCIAAYDEEQNPNDP